VADGRAMIRGFGVWELWVLPVMYTVFRDLRFLAIQVFVLLALVLIYLGG